MRLTHSRRLLYGVMALASGYMVARTAGRSDWIGAALAAVMLLLFGLPALWGRDPLAMPAPGARRPAEQPGPTER